MQQTPQTVIEAAMAGAPRGMQWHLTRASESGEPLGYELRCAGTRAAVTKVGTRWVADLYEEGETVGRYPTADRAMVAVNLRLGPQPEREVELDRRRIAEILRAAVLILRGAAGTDLTAPQLAAAALNRASGPAVDMDDIVMLLQTCQVGKIRADFAIHRLETLIAMVSAQTEAELIAAAERMAEVYQR